MPKLNLEKIGERAGVSRSTVSRVINDEPNVSESVRKRVQKVIAETGYRPHAAARSLASSRTGVIGLIIPGAVSTLFDDPYFGHLILGMTSATNDAGMTLALLLSEEDDSSVISRVVTPGLVDGVVVTASHLDEPVIDGLVDANLPFVVVGRADRPGLRATVDVDNQMGSKNAAKHLLGLGRKRFAMIGAPVDTSADVDRRAGFEAGLAEAGLSLEGRYAHGDWTQDSGQHAMAELLDHRPDAVFVASDRMAVGALRAIEGAGLRCPQDVAVVSFDGLVPANHTTPRLTAVTQPVRRVGERAVQLLNAAIRGEVETPEHVVFSTELVVRESCGGSAP